ncbi:hypothetical protein [Saccharopolyspora hattusasensis]|uniref:hypothetical protein n=1 Tax=Saccharopolyspora hattusasensis TaxID=1128679 RepID=UPI003D9951E7
MFWPAGGGRRGAHHRRKRHRSFAALHDAIYCQGAASQWSAHRVRAEFDEFDWPRSGRVNFTGEMIYPWLFGQDPSLVRLREAAELLASTSTTASRPRQRCWTGCWR